ncbi:MAG: P-loop NTPase fold protein [Cyanobacteria bacterium P01_G01_bin.38]
MLIRQADLEVPIDNPFQNDALNRKELEPPLTQFITQASGPLVLALDGSWGSGKTTFLKMWQVKLKEAEHACLYLNAWKTDFAQEPLVAVVGELSTAIESFAPTGQKGDVLRKQIKKARQIAESIAKRSIPVGVKLATLGILDTQDLTEKIISDFASEIVEDRIKDYEQGKTEIEEFRKSFQSLSKEVSKLKSDTLAKVVVIIDELDRCRPIYAVQLLERIKHLFDVPGVVFILGIDRSQLNHSIKALYGTDFDAQGYLRRFIDLDYRLPEPKAGDYCSYLFERFGINQLMAKRKTQDRQGELHRLKSFLGCFMSSAGMSLRAQEQTVSRLRIVLQTIPTNHFLFEVTLSMFLFLREWDHDVYKSLNEGKIDFETITAYIEGLPRINEVLKESDKDLIEAFLLTGLAELGIISTRLENYQKLVESDSDDPNLNKAQEILRLIGYIQSRNHGGPGFEYTAQRLALTSSFVSYDDESNS